MRLRFLFTSILILFCLTGATANNLIRSGVRVGINILRNEVRNPMVLSAINKAIQDGVTYVVSDTEGYVRWVEKESGEVFPVEDIFQFLSPEFEISLIGTGDQSLEQSANDEIGRAHV